MTTANFIRNNVLKLSVVNLLLMAAVPALGTNVAIGLSNGPFRCVEETTKSEYPQVCRAIEDIIDGIRLNALTPAGQTDPRSFISEIKTKREKLQQGLEALKNSGSQFLERSKPLCSHFCSNRNNIHKLAEDNFKQMFVDIESDIQAIDSVIIDLEKMVESENNPAKFAEKIKSCFYADISPIGPDDSQDLFCVPKENKAMSLTELRRKLWKGVVLTYPTENNQTHADSIFKRPWD